MKEIITFFGGDSKVGTTMIMQSFSEELEKRGEKVLMIFASSEAYDEFLEDRMELTIDSLRENEEINKADVEKIIYKKDNLSYIRGCDKFLKIRYFNVSLLEKVVEICSQDFDYIVIDGGHNYQYPLPISSLKVATKRYFVLTGNSKTISRFDWMYKNILHAKKVMAISDRDEIILNFTEKEDKTYSKEMLEKIYKRKVSTIPKVFNGHFSEDKRETLLKMPNSSRFREGINNLINGI